MACIRSYCSVSEVNEEGGSFCSDSLALSLPSELLVAMMDSLRCSTERTLSSRLVSPAALRFLPFGGFVSVAGLGVPS